MCVRRSYLTPVRDEEAEAQRKARSRHARQSRRSTQVSLLFPVMTRCIPSVQNRLEFFTNHILWQVSVGVCMPDGVFCLQGVTLTDLQEAEKTIKTENKGKDRTKEEEEREAKQKKGEEGVRKVEI